MTLAISLFVHGEAVRFNRGKLRPGDYDFKYMKGSDGNIYPYVSSQCFKRYWREALPNPPSPVTRGKNKKGEEINQVYTDGNPIRYVDDDLFGYMIAGAEEEAGESPTETTEEEKLVTLQDIDSEGFDESVFTAEDMSDPNLFLEAIRNSDNPFAVYLAGQFSSEAKRRMEKHNTNQPMPADLRNVILEEIN
ncbi:MAG: hypothetical protein AAB209_00495, partial [Bacteroidota bacterium]